MSRRQSLQLCRAGNGLSELLPSSQKHLWAQRTEEAGIALALGEQQPRDRDMTAKSSCAPALPGSRCCVEARRELESHWLSRAGFARMPLMQALLADVPAWLPASLP